MGHHEERVRLPRPRTKRRSNGAQFLSRRQPVHGRLLTAWSLAGVAGPVLVNYIREYQISHGVPKADAYTGTMYLMAGLLVVGLIANALVRPVNARHHFSGEQDGAHA